MGGRSKYCLVQCVSIDVEYVDKRNLYKVHLLQEQESGEFQVCRYLFRLTTFSLKFEKMTSMDT